MSQCSPTPLQGAKSFCYQSLQQGIPSLVSAVPRNKQSCRKGQTVLAKPEAASGLSAARRPTLLTAVKNVMYQTNCSLHSRQRLSFCSHPPNTHGQISERQNLQGPPHPGRSELSTEVLKLQSSPAHPFTHQISFLYSKNNLTQFWKELRLDLHRQVMFAVPRQGTKRSG